MQPRLTLVLLVSTLSGACLLNPAPQRGAMAASPIDEGSVRGHMEFLAGDAMNGRGSGTRDEWIAAVYLGSQMRRWGIEPLGDDGGYVQQVTIERRQTSTSPVLSIGSRRFTHGREVLVQSIGAQRVSGPLQKFKDGVPPTAGAVLLLPETVGPPAQGATAGASAVLTLESPQHRSRWEQLGSRTLTLTRLTGVQATTSSRPSTIVLDKVTYAAVAAVQEGTTVTLESELATPQTSHTWNAVGRLSGKDRASASEVILLSAHVDHLGNRTGPGAGNGADTIFNGADDDATGCVAVLELAKALSEGPRPKRTIVFAFFGSEEVGGHGATFFADRPIVPLKQIVANLQFEMIGRPDPAVPADTLWLTGYERSTLGPSLAKRGARLVQDPHPEQSFFTRSDNIRFARRGTVAHTVSSFGLHKEYHQPSDEIRHIDFAHMTEAIRSMLEPIRWLANSGFRPEWLPGMKP